MSHNHEVSFVREAIVSMLVVVGLYGLSSGAQSPLLQIPGYILIVGFDMLEGIFEPVQSDFDMVFGLYLLGLGLAGAVLVHILRTRTPETVSSWRLGVAGAFVVIGVLSLLFALAVLFGSTQLTPVLITGTVGLVFLAVAGWLAGLFGGRSTPATE